MSPFARDPRDRTPDPTRLLIAALIGLVVLLTAGLFFPGPARGATIDPRAAVATSQAAIGRALADVALQDTEGRVVRLASYRGQPLLVSFVYTGCFAACPAGTRFLRDAIAELQRTLGAGTFNVVTVGFNAPFDSPAAMRDFRRRHGADLPQWSFLAGDVATIDTLAHDVGFTWTPTPAGFDHVTQLTLVDPAGRVAAQIYGESFPLPQLAATLAPMVRGASVPALDVGAFIDRVRVLCSVYDPAAGRYRPDWRLLIEIVAGLSVLVAMLAYLGHEWRRQRRSRAAA
jgi:protein SCO1/2